MKLVEYEGKKLFLHYGIPVPRSVLVSKIEELPDWSLSVLKAQVHFGDRMQQGGILFAMNTTDAKEKARSLLGKVLYGEKVTSVLVEDRIEASAEYYISFSYSSESRGPVLSLSKHGGSGIGAAHTVAVPIVKGLTDDQCMQALAEAQFPSKEHESVTVILQKLWKLFIEEYALVAEINPLFKTSTGLVAGDAKIIIDDDKNPTSERRVIEMDGDIAILASGGGASMLNIDALVRAGGKPANYTEYSGNPPADVVKELTKKVLAREGLKGCWVVGAFANFTDIYVTLSGFLDGLREMDPKPTYPIVT